MPSCYQDSITSAQDQSNLVTIPLCCGEGGPCQLLCPLYKRFEFVQGSEDASLPLGTDILQKDT
jgi:hypothetical protein